MKKIFTILFISIILITFNFANAQWVQMSSGMNGRMVFSFLSTGTNIFAGTDGGMYRSTNNGGSWTYLPTGLVFTGFNALLSVGNNIFAGSGGGMGVYLSTNNGANWSYVNNGLTCKSVKALILVGNNIFAGTGQGNLGGVFLSTNNGANWTALNTGLTCRYVNCLLLVGNNIFAGTGDSYNLSIYSGVFLSTNNGVNWTAVNNGLPNQSCIWSLASIGTNLFAGTYAYGVFRSTNNGANWTAVNNGLGVKSVSSLLSVETNIFAGTCYQGEGGVLLSTNNGDYWIQKNQGLFNNIWEVFSLIKVNSYIFAGVDTSSVWRRSYTEIIGIKQISELVPFSYSLQQNYPNPFNPITKIKFDVPKSTNIKLTVYDITGKEIEILANERVSSGTYEVEFNGENYSSGIYFYKLETNDFVQTKKMMFIK